MPTLQSEFVYFGNTIPKGVVLDIFPNGNLGTKIHFKASGKVRRITVDVPYEDVVEIFGKRSARSVLVTDGPKSL